MKQNYMKHFSISVMLAFFMTILALPLSVYASDIRIEINGEQLNVPASEQPIIVDGRTLVPLRLVAEALGLYVEWNEQLQMVSLEASDFVVNVQIGNSEMIVNKRIVPLDVPAQIVNDRTMMPLRAVAEATGMDVIWNDNIRTVHILEPFIPIENWPEHLPEHIPGSITLQPVLAQNRHWTEPPMRFRYAFYVIPNDIMNLIDHGELDTWWPMAELYKNEDINMLMRFVQYFNISREDFDEAMERTREHRIRMGHDFTSERQELPNADIIFTFDNDIIRYFYRRQ